MTRRRAPTTATRPVDVPMPAAGVAAFVSRHGRRFRTADLLHPYHKLCLVEIGRGRLRHRRGYEPLRPGVLLHVPAGEPHRFEDARDARLTLSGLCLAESAVAPTAPLGPAWHEIRKRLPPLTPTVAGRRLAAAEYQGMIRQIVHEMAQGRPHATLACHAIACQFLVALCREISAETGPAVDAFRASVAWMDDHLTRRITIPDLARIAGMSYRSYTARFQRDMGMTVTQYLNRRRVAIARQRLTQTGDIVSSALEAGFGDLSHFYRQFKAHTGLTPAAYLAHGPALRAHH